MFKMFACAAFAAIPTLVAPAVAEEEEMSPAGEVVVAQVQLLADALDVLSSDDSPDTIAEKMNGLTEQAAQIAEAKKGVDAAELKELEEELSKDEDVMKLGETLLQVIDAHAEKGFHGSEALKKAIEAFGAAIQAL